MIPIVIQTEHFVICDKPAGMLSTPARFEDGRECLGRKLEQELQCQIFPVHRLDFEVSGLVLYALSAEAHRAGNGWFEKRCVTKTYRALTLAQDFSHIPSQVSNLRQPIELDQQSEFVWKSRILRGKKRSFESEQGKPSETHARYLGNTPEGYLKWDLNPVTGRPHQLRFDLSRHGFPILGDHLYGSKQEWSKSTIALRSYRLDFSKCDHIQMWKLPREVAVSEELSR